MLVSQQAGFYEFFASLHHMLPHFICATFFVEKYASLFPGHRAAMFVCQSQNIRNCDFGHYSFSILLFSHDIHPSVLERWSPLGYLARQSCAVAGS
jgi:hypothetical protein